MPKLFLGLLLLIYPCSLLFAQYQPMLEVGIGSGAAIYQGDLSPHRFGSLRKAGLGLQLFGQLVFSSSLSVRLNYNFSSLQEGDKSYSFTYKQYRNFFFQTNVNEFAAQIVLNPLRNNGSEDDRRLQPYVFAGAGLARLRINRDWSRFDYGWKHWQDWVRPGLAGDSAKVLPALALTLPVGLGFRFFVGENISLFAELGHRFTNEEYLDGFSLAANPKKKDGFTTVTAGLIFRRL